MANSEKEVYQKLLEKLNTSGSILTAGEIHPDIPTIHSIAGTKYHPSVRHIGYGCFIGKTEHGEFTFDGGGAMYRESIPGQDYFLSWCPLTASQEVLDDLGYNTSQVISALESLITE